MPPRAVTKRSTRRPSIVFADNDPLVREAIVELLRSKGYDVHVAEDGLAAWVRIRHVRPTYVILDVVMPKVDGGQVCWGSIRSWQDFRPVPLPKPSTSLRQVFDQLRCRVLHNSGPTSPGTNILRTASAAPPSDFFAPARSSVTRGS